MAFADIAVPWQGADGAAKRMAADIEKKEVILKKAKEEAEEAKKKADVVEAAQEQVCHTPLPPCATLSNMT